jgi:hypothetical protein
MVTTLLQAQQQQSATANDFMHEIINKVYPELFRQIDSILSVILLLQADERASELSRLTANIKAEINNLYQMEKEVLFPFIAILAEENKKSESCKLFKDTKVHYTALLKLITELKSYIRVYIQQDGSPLLLDAILDSLHIFEQQNVLLQVTKDKYLFAQFKSCSGCKTI